MAHLLPSTGGAEGGIGGGGGSEEGGGGEGGGGKGGGREECGGGEGGGVVRVVEVSVVNVKVVLVSAAARVGGEGGGEAWCREDGDRTVMARAAPASGSVGKGSVGRGRPLSRAVARVVVMG